MWDDRLLLESAAQALRSAADALDAEQAVSGLDALEELDFHALLASGLAAAEAPDPAVAPGWGVLREQPYPGDRTASHRPTPDDAAADPDADLAAESDRQRCDLVLTPRPGLTLADPVRLAKQTRARRREAAGTLFEPLASRLGAELAAQPEPDPSTVPTTVPPEEAFWLEVKLVGQFCYEAGIPGPNRTYASQLVRGAAADLAKLARDPHIHHAALLIILFTETPEVAEHDLIATMHRCLDRGVAASTPITAPFPITDRIGNHTCTPALIRAACRR